MKSKINEEQKKEWVVRYLAGETARSISKDYPISESTVSRYFQKIGINRGRGSKFTPEFIEKILKEYQEDKYATFSSLSQKYNICDRTISEWVTKNNIIKKNNSGKISHCNQNYFDIIDNPNKAYLLGFITADGAITGKKHNPCTNCSIEIHKKDIDLIKFAQQEINPKAAITECNYNNKTNVKISFSSIYLANSLKKYGIVPNKSKIIKRVPKEYIPNNLLKFYFRGLIDGDGCIHKNGGISIYSGSEDFIKDVQNILAEEIGVPKLKIYYGTTYFISWYSKKDRQQFFDYLYKDCLNDTFYYKRKYERLLNSLQDNTEVTN